MLGFIIELSYFRTSAKEKSTSTHQGEKAYQIWGCLVLSLPNTLYCLFGCLFEELQKPLLNFLTSELKSNWVSLCNSTTAKEPCGLECILDKICLSFIFNWVLAETNKLTLIISQITWTTIVQPVMTRYAKRLLQRVVI